MPVRTVADGNIQKMSPETSLVQLLWAYFKVNAVYALTTAKISMHKTF